MSSLRFVQLFRHVDDGLEADEGEDGPAEGR